MPRYEVTSVGFYDGVLRKPGHPRHGFVQTDKPLKPVPTWLKLVKEETATERKKRLAEETKQLGAVAAKAKQDKIDIDSVMFTESPKQSGVETL